MGEIKFERLEHYGTLSTSSSGWKKELNLIGWNGRAGKYDLREWSPDDERMGKGITLTAEELKALKALLLDMEL